MGADSDRAHDVDMGEKGAGAEHDLLGLADAGFGEQAFCSCGWRTAPKDSGWEASVVWHEHMASYLPSGDLAAH